MIYTDSVMSTPEIVNDNHFIFPRSVDIALG